MRPHTFAPTELARDIYDTFLLEFSLANASYLIFDEADKLFEAEFREQVRQFCRHLNFPSLIYRSADY